MGKIMERLFNSLVVVAMFLAAYILTEVYAGRFEGQAYPVVTQVTFTKIDPVGDTRSRIYGSFYKERGSCDFDDIQFYLGQPWQGVRVDRVLEEGAKERGGGYEDFGPWLVQLDAEQFAGRSYAVVEHRCHPFWLTKTIFYNQEGVTN